MSGGTFRTGEGFWADPPRSVQSALRLFVGRLCAISHRCEEMQVIGKAIEFTTAKA
jgi:hypothetical protein